MDSTALLRTINLDGAAVVLDAAVERARQLGFAACVAVVDPAGQLVAFQRMDGSSPISISMSVAKAKTAATLLMDTKQLQPLTQPGAPLYGLVGCTNSELVTFGGGVVLHVGGVGVGGVGVSGGSVEQDGEVAEAAASALPEQSRSRSEERDERAKE